MMLKEQYIESLRKMKINLYMFGEKVDNRVDHPIIKPSLNAVAMTYELAQDPLYEELMTATSSLSGEKINRFTHLHQNTEDLINKVKMQRLLGQKTATCFQRCVGMDAVNSIESTTYEMDQEYGTDYHRKFLAYLQEVQQKDLVVDGAMTDPKGDRGLSPSKQADPDLYVHIVKELSGGIIIRGAKAHQTGALNSHELLIMPTIAMTEEDKDYAICCAVPADTEGILYIYGRQASDTRRLEGGSIDVGNFNFGGQEALVILNDVFVPWERVFMYKEYKYTGILVERFAGYHRQSYGGCKVGVGDVLIGASALAAEYNGVEKASHIKDKLIEMTFLNETLYSCGIACSSQGCPTKSGTFLIDLLLANVCKLNVTRLPYEIARIAEDLAGGLMVTMPSEKDMKSAEVGPLIEKYLKGICGVPTEYRLRILRLIENLTIGAGAVGYRTESLHGAGSPQAQRVMIGRQANLAWKKELAKNIAGIDERQL